MESVIFTPRLKLISINAAEKGSPEFDWLHELHSNEKSTFWALSGRAATPDDTVARLNAYLPSAPADVKTYRVVYAIHRLLDTAGEGVGVVAAGAEDASGRATESIGLVFVHSLEPGKFLPLPEELTLPAAAAETTLTVELAYMFLPGAWGKGYGTEAVNAVLDACRRTPTFWAPFRKLYVLAIVNGRNPASQRVLAKTPMVKRGIFTWAGKPIFIGGLWVEKDDLVIYGCHLIGEV